MVIASVGELHGDRRLLLRLRRCTRFLVLVCGAVRLWTPNRLGKRYILRYMRDVV